MTNITERRRERGQDLAEEMLKIERSEVFKAEQGSHY